MRRRPTRAIRNAALGLIAVVCVLLIVAVAALELSHLNDRHALGQASSALHSARAAVAQSVRTRQLAAAIQQSRYATILGNCRDQNARHDLTIKRLDHGYALALRRIRQTAQRRELRESQQFSIGLIEALAPKRDCSQVTSAQTAVPKP